MSDNKVELKPCPFCGSDDLHITSINSADRTIIWSKIHHGTAVPCGASMLDSDINKLIKRWNTRI